MTAFLLRKIRRAYTRPPLAGARRVPIHVRPLHRATTLTSRTDP